MDRPTLTERTGAQVSPVEQTGELARFIRVFSAASEILSEINEATGFQQRVQPWLLACFGAEIAADRMERNHRFFEESTEAVQANGMTRSEAHQLVDYTFDRPVGELSQEVGGVMITLAALCLASGVDMHQAAEVELERIWTKLEAIRAKQAAKPKHSPLPGDAAPSALQQAAPNWWRKRADEIEVGVAQGMSAMNCYTQMRQLLDATTDQPSRDPKAA